MQHTDEIQLASPKQDRIHDCLRLLKIGVIIYIGFCLLTKMVLGVPADLLNIRQVIALAGDKYGLRAKEFMADWGKQILRWQSLSELNQLERINSYFNQKIEFVDDRSLWGSDDHWASLLELADKQAGDCEDFVIAKYVSLLNAGVDDSKLRLTYVLANRGTGRSEPHMVLSYFATPESIPLILDNLDPRLLRASARTDLAPVYSFNALQMWLRNDQKVFDISTDRISKWRDLLFRLKSEGVLNPILQ